MNAFQHIVSVSGGKDSAAVSLRALELAEKAGFSFRAVFADTGHEHPWTYDHVRALAARTGGPEVEWVRADLSARFRTKRETIATKWRAKGVAEDRVRAALSACRPTGVPFLDLRLLKGRFPSTRARFCSQDLKRVPIDRHVTVPALERGPVVMWTGVRADESVARARLPRVNRGDLGEWIYRPILHWTVDDVFAIHRRHGLEPNPLYKAGCRRVGCMPCIHAAKSELRNIAARFPERIDRIEAWEAQVGQASKRGASTFFSADKTPGPHKRDKRLPVPGVRDVVAWSLTGRGGRQGDLFLDDEFRAPPACASEYGLCE